MQRANVWVIQCGDRSRFALKTVRELLAQDLDRDEAVDPRISGFVHFAHATGAKVREDLEMLKTIANCVRHFRQIAGDSFLADTQVRQQVAKEQSTRI